jgi:ubiquitin carboxyl-terminal hydrolase 9/24
MMDDAVTSWKPEIHQYIYDSCLKLIELCVAKLADDWFPLLELLSMIFNGNNKFHQVNNSEPAKMLPRDGSTASEILYAESHDHYVKGWLVDFVNTFGNLNGFNILRDRIVKGSNLSVPVMAALLKPFTGCVQVLAIKCVENYLLPCCDRVLEAVETLTDDDLKKEVKNESKSDSLSSIVKSLKVMYQRVPERQAMLEEIETFRLKMILRLLRISSFSGKMNALNEVNRLVQSVYSFSSRTAYDDEETGVTAERLADWIQENSVLSIVLKDNLHQPQYVERLEKILWFMIRQKALSQDDLDTLWAAQVDKHEAIVKNVHDLLARLAWNFSAEQLDYLFQCFQRSWTHAGKRQREKLLELIRRLAEDDKEGVMAVKVLGLLWNLAHSEDCPKEIMEQALAAHIKILDYSCAADRDRQKTHWLVRCIDELKQDLWVLPAIKMIHDIFSMYFEVTNNK